MIKTIALSLVASCLLAQAPTPQPPGPGDQSALPTAIPNNPDGVDRPKRHTPDPPLRVKREAPLPEGARQALSLSQTSVDEGTATHMGADGRIIFTYGKGTPTIVCALLNITEVDLEPGEAVVKDGLDLGDGGKEFFVTARHAGSGTSAYDYLTIKPISSDVEMTMTVGTNRRVYYLRVRSTENNYMTRIAFSYPEDKERARQQLQQLQQLLSQQSQAAASALPMASMGSKYGALNIPALPEIVVRPWKYTLKKKGRDAGYFVPITVGDDGSHTHIELAKEARVRGLPVLQISDASGPIPANWHWEETTLIVDALFEKGCLLEGVGKNQQSVCIYNQKGVKEKKNGAE